MTGEEDTDKEQKTAEGADNNVTPQEKVVTSGAVTSDERDVKSDGEDLTTDETSDGEVRTSDETSGEGAVASDEKDLRSYSNTFGGPANETREEPSNG